MPCRGYILKACGERVVVQPKILYSYIGSVVQLSGRSESSRAEEDVRCVCRPIRRGDQRDGRADDLRGDLEEGRPAQ